MGVKSVNIEFDKVPVSGFELGSSVTGHVKIITNKATHIKNIYILLQGKARSVFLTHQIYWFKDKPFHRRNEEELGFGRVFDVDWNAITFRRRLSDKSWFRAEQSFIENQHQLAGEVFLEEGITEYPFFFKLPDNLPSTFCSSHGEIRYKLKVKWTRSGLLATTETYKVELKIINIESLALLQSRDPQLFGPKVYEEVRSFKLLFFSGQPIVMRMTLPRSIVMNGETINVAIQIDNPTNININTVHVRFVKRTVWIGKHGIHKNVKMEDEILQGISSDGVLASTNKSWYQTILIDAAPNVCIEPCSVIKQCHFIVVEAVPSGIYTNVSLVAPIKVCFGSIQDFPNGPKTLTNEPSTSKHQDSSEPPSYQDPPPYSEVCDLP